MALRAAAMAALAGIIPYHLFVHTKQQHDLCDHERRRAFATCLYLIENHCCIAYQLIIADAPGVPTTTAVSRRILLVSPYVSPSLDISRKLLLYIARP